MTSERLRIIATWVVAVLVAILVLLASRSSSEPARADRPGPARPAGPQVVTHAQPPARGALERAQAALAGGASCADRAIAVEQLRALGDPAALPALQSELARARRDACPDAAIRHAIRELLVRRNASAY